MLLARIDVAEFVSALQRWGHAPNIIHAKTIERPDDMVSGKSEVSRLQSVSGWWRPVRRSRITPAYVFRLRFQEGKADWALYARCRVSLCLGTTEAAFTQTLPCHLLDCVSRQKRKVVRATFSAELMGACDSTDKGMLLTQRLH